MTLTNIPSISTASFFHGSNNNAPVENYNMVSNNLSFTLQLIAKTQVILPEFGNADPFEYEGEIDENNNPCGVGEIIHQAPIERITYIRGTWLNG